MRNVGINDPNKYIIYTPGAISPNKVNEAKKTDETQKGGILKSLNKHLNAVKDFFCDTFGLSNIKQSEEKETKKAGEKLSSDVSSSVKQEKETNKEETIKKNETIRSPFRPKLAGMSGQKGSSPKLKADYTDSQLDELRNKTKGDYEEMSGFKCTEKTIGKLDGKVSHSTLETVAKELKGTHSREEFMTKLNSLVPDSAEREAIIKAVERPGFVNAYHNDHMGLEKHEEAQFNAYNELSKAIDGGAVAVKPGAIQADMLRQLDLKDKPDVRVGSFDKISSTVGAELQELTSKGLIKADEAKLIQAEADKFAAMYKEAFPDAKPQDVFEVVRDNSRKLAYQTERDKHVFSGSDHGTRHVLEGNMNMADRMIENLEKAGKKVTAKDKVMIHQIITDHDLGYTVGVAQAKGSFEASKDHPLFSTKFVEENKDYYVSKFGQDGYQMIKDGILLHSYPKSEYNTPTDQTKGFNPDLVRSISSTVDALGVTAETKCPAFFRQPDVVKVLQKIQLYAETHDGKVPDNMLDKYKGELRKLADKEPDATRKEGYLDAINNQFNPKTVEMTLGQYTGVLKDIDFETDSSGKILPKIHMNISESQALLGNVFGDDMSLKAFTKAMADFGVPKSKMAEMAKTLKEIKEAKTDGEKQELIKKLRYDCDKAVFQFGQKTEEEANPELKAYVDVFKDLDRVSVRQEVRDLASGLLPADKEGKPLPVDAQKASELIKSLSTSISENGTTADLREFRNLQDEIQNNLNDRGKLEETVKKLKAFTTKAERDFMGIS